MPWTRTMRLIALALMMLALLGLAPPAHADVATGQDAATRCALVKPTDDDTISILGRICDRRQRPPLAVPGVTVSVEDADGNQIGEATSAEDGTFVIDLPGTAIEHLGKSYTVTLDESTLPEDTKPEISSRTLTINIDNDQTVLFPIGDAGPVKPGKFTEAMQLMVGGLVFSVVLAMAALGLSMIFGTTGLTNFSHGELVTFGALVAFFIDRLPGRIEIGGAEITVIVGVIAAFVVGGVFGWLNDAALWRPLRSRGTGLVAMMIVSIGLSLFLRNIYQYFAGAQSRNYSQYGAVAPWQIGDILLTPKELVVILLGLAVLVMTTSLLQFTRLGKATRAVSDNPGLASATGINVERVIRIVWVGGAALAGLAGALLGVTQGFDFQIGFRILLLTFAAVVLGGLGTIWGAIVGAFVIGLFTELSTLFVDPEFKFVGALLLLIVILLIRPQGLLGRAQRIG
ncbi:MULTISPECIES: ABC transporter permease subunit [Nocardioides]|uniref:Branched-chain amino acid ABC transporter permease n=1 Tax=Nocardioides vastitatis TaxID=2568655 RepID=A0ABW0ZGM3_9ACTN|nr:branched-chain amino acid ABC transporter permease [Nocardioides sp.]THI96382.1 branched-chain amino acid ABC transporter permease [Nocardioides sp.]